MCVCVYSVAQLCPTICNPMDCSPQLCSVHEIFQARVLERVAISFSRRSSWPRDWTGVSCIAGRHFTLWATREAVTLENNLTVLYVVKRKITILLSSFTLAVYPWGKKMYAHPKTCTWNFIAAFFIIAQKWGPSKCPSANEWINKTCVHRMESYSTIKRRDVLIYDTACSMSEDIT